MNGSRASQGTRSAPGRPPQHPRALRRRGRLRPPGGAVCAPCHRLFHGTLSQTQPRRGADADARRVPCAGSRESFGEETLWRSGWVRSFWLSWCRWHSSSTTASGSSPSSPSWQRSRSRGGGATTGETHGRAPVLGSRLGHKPRDTGLSLAWQEPRRCLLVTERRRHWRVFRTPGGAGLGPALH